MPEIPADEGGRRCSDIVRQKIADGHAGRWLAIRLCDGGSDGVPYDTMTDAVRHQLHWSQCAYVKIPRDDMPPGEATRWLALHRMLYDKGLRMTDPDGPPREVMVPMELEKARQAVAQIERAVGLGR